MADSIYKWSLAAASNDAADSAINWRENQLPDTVNDSNRAMMMRIAEWREDMTGGLVTTGTSPAYLLAGRAAFDNLTDGRFITARIHATNVAGAATLNVNGLGAKAIRKFGTSGDLPLAIGDLQLGGLYQFMYSALANAGAGAWVIANPSSGPSGSFVAGTSMLFIQAAAPLGWTKQTTHDNKALRIVSGAGAASGGTVAFTSAFASYTPSGTVGDHAITAAQMPYHAHTQQGSFGSGGVSANHYHGVSGGTSGFTTNHTHSLTLSGLNYTQWNVGGSGGQGTYGAAMGAVGNTNWGDRDHSHNFSVNSGYFSSDHSHVTTISGATTYAGSGAVHNHTWTGVARDFTVQYVDAIICNRD